jgi:hypothetical protein
MKKIAGDPAINDAVLSAGVTDLKSGDRLKQRRGTE